MKVSIAIPFFNSGDHLELAILSVLAQTHQDWELILLDDGSTDDSLKIARKYADLDDRIRVLSDGQNRKLPYRLNQVTMLAQYDLIARMDADDLMATDRIQRQVEFLKRNSDFDLVTTGVCSINKKNEVVGARVPTVSYQELTLEKMFRGQHEIVHASILAKKSWYLRNKYDVKIERAQDYELWIRAFLANDLKIGYLSYLGYYYREDLGITKDKLLKTYKIGWIIIDKFSPNLDNVLQKKIILLAKSLVINFIFLFKLEGYLQQRGLNSKIDDSLVNEVSLNIKKITKLKQLINLQ